MCSGSTTLGDDLALGVHQRAGRILRPRARWWRSRCGTASSASPGRCREARFHHFQIDRVDGIRFTRLAWICVTMMFFHSSTARSGRGRSPWCSRTGRGCRTVQSCRRRAFALIDRAFHGLPSNRTYAFAQGILQCLCRSARRLHRRTGGTRPVAAHAVGDDFAGSSGALWPNIVLCCPRQKVGAAPRAPSAVSFAAQGHGDLVALAGVAHVERALDADAVGREAVAAQLVGACAASARTWR